ncbi:MAG: hypothetical protein Q9174_004202, partial [Haloplaca sp. 1 TL-2023]
PSTAVPPVLTLLQVGPTNSRRLIKVDYELDSLSSIQFPSPQSQVWVDMCPLQASLLRGSCYQRAVFETFSFSPNGVTETTNSILPEQSEVSVEQSFQAGQVALGRIIVREILKTRGLYLIGSRKNVYVCDVLVIIVVPATFA